LISNRPRLQASLAIAIVAASFPFAAQAQTFTVLHSFTGGADGAMPEAGLTVDASGRLYGTGSKGGIQNGECPNDGQAGCGVVFRLARQGSGWTIDPLHQFQGPSGDGSAPTARPVLGPGGTLYGTTSKGGSYFCEGPGCGIAYNLRPGATSCLTALCSWSEVMQYSFGEAGEGPNGELTFDQAGNAYGTLDYAVFTLMLSDGAWQQTNLHSFDGGGDGKTPVSGVIFDPRGNLYGTTLSGGGQGCSSMGCGIVYQLVPGVSGWTENILYAFQGAADGDSPVGRLIMDATGNLYGTAFEGGQNGGGTVFELSPSGNTWNFTLLYSLGATGVGSGPTGSLAFDSSGSLYGTASGGGALGRGAIFKLTPSNGIWTYTSLHDFTGSADGADPVGNVIFDANGNLYGTASLGGLTDLCGGAGCGVVWQITP
jgi:uncharacterized repeat protein (TIGR03803 family)